MNGRNVSIALLIAALLLPAAAASQEGNKWDFELAPFYLWAINIDGDLGIKGRTASVDIDFGDIWDNLENVFTARFAALYNNKFGFLVDYNYLDLGTEKVTDSINTEVDFKSHILNLAGSYRIYDKRHVLDGLAGIRYTSLESTVDFNNLGVRLEGEEDWIDPILGFRYSFAFTDSWAIRLYGDVGGFGAGSDFTWQGLGLVEFQPWQHVVIVAGYRAIYADYESGSGTDTFSYDATTHGPIIGFDIRW